MRVFWLGMLNFVMAYAPSPEMVALPWQASAKISAAQIAGEAHATLTSFDAQTRALLQRMDLDGLTTLLFQAETALRMTLVRFFGMQTIGIPLLNNQFNELSNNTKAYAQVLQQLLARCNLPSRPDLKPIGVGTMQAATMAVTAFLKLFTSILEVDSTVLQANNMGGARRQLLFRLMALLCVAVEKDFTTISVANEFIG